ncbi:MAG: class I SAM-dependent methyltransferase [Pseudomonadota bacterium]
MTALTTVHPPIRLAPITRGQDQRNPRILLGGAHQPTLLRYLDGWPPGRGRPRAFLIQFVGEEESLARFARDSFDLAVVQSPSAERLETVVRELVRVARQGLITRTGEPRAAFCRR